MKIQPVRGTHDLYAQKLEKFKFIQETVNICAHIYDFNEIITPIFEFTELFLKPLGENSDVVLKEMYTFDDRNDSSLTLRPEYTTPIIRAAISNNLLERLPTKLYGIGPMFRRERPQKGRFRQFKQFGLEAFGSKFPEQDAEIIAMAYSLYESLNIEDLELKINSIGSKESRKEYKTKLKDYFKQYKDQLTSTSKKRLETNPLRILDTKIDFEIELIKNAPKISDYLNNDDKIHFNKILEMLDSLKIPYTIDESLVRGLDYYSKTVFEIQTNSLGAQNALCGGGRYDYLVEELGGENTPAIGFAAGFERLLMAMNINIEEIERTPDIYIISLGDKAIKYAFDLAKKLRMKKNIIVINDTLRRSLKSQMKDANRLKAHYTLIVGEDEIKSKTLSLKNMDTGEQNNIPIDKILDQF